MGAREREGCPIWRPVDQSGVVTNGRPASPRLADPLASSARSSCRFLRPILRATNSMTGRGTCGVVTEPGIQVHGVEAELVDRVYCVGSELGVPCS